MDKTVRYEIEGTVIELPLKYDERSQKDLEDYGSFLEQSPFYTPEGRPILLIIEDACQYGKPVEGEPRCIDCGSCIYFCQHPSSLLGVCHHEKMRSGTGNPSGPGAHEEETR